jgi:hypothetical protein
MAVKVASRAPREVQTWKHGRRLADVQRSSRFPTPLRMAHSIPRDRTDGVDNRAVARSPSCAKDQALGAG